MSRSRYQNTDGSESKYTRSNCYQLRRIELQGGRQQQGPTEYKSARFKLVREGTVKAQPAKPRDGPPASARCASSRPNVQAVHRLLLSRPNPQHGPQVQSAETQVPSQFGANPQPLAQQQKQQHRAPVVVNKAAPASQHTTIQQQPLGQTVQDCLQPSQPIRFASPRTSGAFPAGFLRKQHGFKASRNSSQTKWSKPSATRRIMTWRKPSGVLEMPSLASAETQPPLQAVAARTTHPPLQAHSAQQPAAGSMRTKQPPWRKQPGKKWNKYTRHAFKQSSPAMASRQATLLSTPPALPAGQRKWNKYVRALRLASPGAAVAAPPSAQSAPAAVAATARQSSMHSSRGIKLAARKTTFTRRKMQQLLRLGSSMYKVSSAKGRSRSLHRQASPSTQPTVPRHPKPPQQQHEQQQQAASHGQRQTAAPALPATKPRTALEGGKRPLSGAKGAALLQRFRRSSARQARAPPIAHPRTTGRGSRAAPAAGAGRIVYCPLYCRTGKCERRGKGCPFKHDPVKRAVCPRWLRGGCTASPCPLQHQRVKDLMPVCMHFLKGLCSATDCPYLHVNLSPEAPLCKAFLRGYCPAGARCLHKHYTLRMVKEERRVEQAPKARRAQREQRQPGMQGGVATGRKLLEETEAVASRKRRGGGRYFDAGASHRAATKRRLDSGGAGAAPLQRVVASGAAVEAGCGDVVGAVSLTPASPGGEALAGEAHAVRQRGGGGQQKMGEGGQDVGGGGGDGPDFLMEDIIPL